MHGNRTVQTWQIRRKRRVWLALKFGLAQMCEHFLKNVDNKFVENQRETASSSYPPRNLNNGEL